MKNKIENIFFYLLLIFFSSFIFFYFNPIKYWYEGNIENLYFIYNSILSSIKIKPLVIDYPGTPSFIINGYIYSFFLGSFSSFVEISNTYQINEYLNNTLKINKYIQLVYLTIYFIFIFKILNEINYKKYLNFLLTLCIIFSPPMIENFQLARIENDALCFMSVGIYSLIRFVKTDRIQYFFFFSFFFILMLLTKLIYVFVFYFLIILIFYFKKIEILKKINKTHLIISIATINTILFFLLYGLQLLLNKLYFISIFFSIATYGFAISVLLYLFFILEKNLKKIIICTALSLIILILVMYFTNSNFSHIYYAIFPFDLLKQHLRGAHVLNANFLDQIFLILNKIYTNFSEFKIYMYEIIFLTYFFIYSMILKKFDLTNFFIIFLFLLFKFIFNIKYYLYYDSITILLLIIVFSNISIFEKKYSYLLSFLLLFVIIGSTYKIFLFEELQWNSKKNSNIIIRKFCKYSEISENEFNDLDIDDHDNYALYHAKNLMTYKNVKEICSAKTF